MDHLSTIIEDILLEIGSHLDEPSKITYLLTCKRIKNVCVKLIPDELLSKNDDLIDNAIIYGYLNIIKWARENNFSYSELACFWAYRNVEILDYLRNDGCQWDRQVGDNAIIGGYLDVIKYCHFNNCPGNQRWVWYSADKYQLHILK